MKYLVLRIILRLGIFILFSSKTFDILDVEFLTFVPSVTFNSTVSTVFYYKFGKLKFLAFEITATAGDWTCGFKINDNCELPYYTCISSFFSAVSNATYTAFAKMSPNESGVTLQANGGYTTLPIDITFSGSLLYV